MDLFLMFEIKKLRGKIWDKKLLLRQSVGKKIIN